jgi:iron-sulfur cluster repair protein YtfE (RIC family)
MTDLHEPTLGELVLANPAAARVLDARGLDYCCRNHGQDR